MLTTGQDPQNHVSESMRFLRRGSDALIRFSEEFKGPQRIRNSNSRDSAKQIHSNGCLETLGAHVPRIPYG